MFMGIGYSFWKLYCGVHAGQDMTIILDVGLDSDF